MKIYEACAAFDAEELENAENKCTPIGLAIVFGEEASPEGRFGITMEMKEKAKAVDLKEFKGQANRLLCKDMFPAFDPENHTEFVEDLYKGASDVFPKKVSLLSCRSKDRNDFAGTKDLVLAELRTCEMLKQSPHPNLATYLGCRVEHGFVTGMYYERYSDLEDVSPIPVKIYVADMRNGIEHLHSLRLCHNNINPYNVMVKHDKSAVIIDFDACLPIGEEMLKWLP